MSAAKQQITQDERATDLHPPAAHAARDNAKTTPPVRDVSDLAEPTLAAESPARALLDVAHNAFARETAHAAERAEQWPPGATVLFVMGVCGAFWAALFFGVIRPLF